MNLRDASTARPWKHRGSHAGQMRMGPDDLPVVWIPSGEFDMGAEWPGADDNETPVHLVRITKGFWLGKCVVTNEKFAEFMNGIETRLTGAEEVVGASGRLLFVMSWGEIRVVGKMGFAEPLHRGHRFQTEPGREQYPAVGVTWYGANAYADHHRLQLPTEAQWEYAARGPESQRYPWGDEWDPDKCCNAENPGADGGKRYPAISLPEGESCYHALNMAGNVWECCADWFDPAYYRKSPKDDPKGPAKTGNRSVRGGSFGYGEYGCTTTARLGPQPQHTTDSQGFRCAYTPESEASGEES